MARHLGLHDLGYYFLVTGPSQIRTADALTKMPWIRFHQQNEMHEKTGQKSKTPPTWSTA
jgi:hypothetical protein